MNSFNFALISGKPEKCEGEKKYNLLPKEDFTVTRSKTLLLVTLISAPSDKHLMVFLPFPHPRAPSSVICLPFSPWLMPIVNHPFTFPWRLNVL